MPDSAATSFVSSPPCRCLACQSYCRRACWPTPDEAARLIDAGMASRLMLDAWIGGFDGVSSDSDCWLVCPATPGYEGRMAPGLGDAHFFSGILILSGGGCTFHVNNLCQLHRRGLKPAEGRVAHHAVESPELHESVARTWYSEQGRSVVTRFCQIAGIESPYPESVACLTDSTDSR